MIATSPIQPNGEYQHAIFADPAFDPHPGFDFDDTDHDVLRGMQNDLAPLSVFNHGGYSGLSTVARQSGPQPSSFGSFQAGPGAFTPGMDSSIDPTKMYAEAGMVARTPAILPPTFQTNIAHARSDSVAEKFGQVTPPDSTPPNLGDRKTSTSSSQDSKVEKLSKSERARNAANQRHAKSKQARQARETNGVSRSRDGAEDGEEGVEVRKEKYREKNRVAAAKCRSKKKYSVDGLEEDYRTLNATHNFLTRELRELRDEFSALRTVALQHTSDTQGCGCAGLHEYNRRKASQVAYGLGGPMVMSPHASDEISFSGQTSSLSRGPLAEMFGQPQAFPPSSNIGFAPVTTQGSMAMTVTSNDNREGFSSYLNGSAERDGFQS
ncbi:hypothetical protein B0A55_09489 [Friedmanniomyces simplex]|uniref:BZIP domain-containing protein n=1 Tax=Friedmanniomyces simplex TaxID=329884 RepID=A0A4U0WKP3_9PEZI|nr:hypothetical protein B0A55_09489 [Friedmanniomyces simplex]